ncbi:MAG: ribokinase [Armatimonas sp.]
MSHPSIVVVGSANTDLVVAVANIPLPGETVLGGDMMVVPGGKGANQAVACARLGGKTTFVARVGDDAYGAAAIAGYERDGINTRYITKTPSAPSGVALIAVSATGENAIVVAPGANARLSAFDIQAASEAFDTADAVLVSLEIPADAVFAAVEAAHARSKPIILNPAPARALPYHILSKLSVLTPNESEANFYGGVDTLQQLGVKTIVTTLGGRGAVIVGMEPPAEFVPAFPVTAVDTVAAGDTFSGGLTVKLAEGAPLNEAVRFANAAAALKVTRHGAQPGIPTRAEVEGYLASQTPL